MTEEIARKDNQSKIAAQRFIAKVYGWMFFALVISGLSAFFTAYSPFMTQLLWGYHKIGIWTVLILEFLLVFILSATIKKISLPLASFFFFLYSLINGITLSAIFMIFDINSIFRAFFISAGTFGIMTLYGRRTTQNLHAAGRYIMMVIVGLILASAVNLLFKSSIFEWIITLVTLVAFIGLTAYDTQKILRLSELSDDSEDFQKASIISALELYLDFINIFLSILRLFSRSKD
ncbi:MAG: Bax inhibitor-1/YccA family protein [Treponema sp.]|nr:Bax inhibitor-1/YccA family protein [Treponema sp.]